MIQHTIYDYNITMHHESNWEIRGTDQPWVPYFGTGSGL